MPRSGNRLRVGAPHRERPQPPGGGAALAQVVAGQPVGLRGRSRRGRRQVAQVDVPAHRAGAVQLAAVVGEVGEDRQVAPAHDERLRRAALDDVPSAAHVAGLVPRAVLQSPAMAAGDHPQAAVALIHVDQRHPRGDDAQPVRRDARGAVEVLRVLMPVEVPQPVVGERLRQLAADVEAPQVRDLRAQERFQHVEHRRADGDAEELLGPGKPAPGDRQVEPAGRVEVGEPRQERAAAAGVGDLAVAQEALGQLADRPFQQAGRRPEHLPRYGAGHDDVPLALVAVEQRCGRRRHGIRYLPAAASDSRSRSRPAFIMSCT